VTALVGSYVGWAGAMVCTVAVLVALTLRRPCISAGPRGQQPLLVLLGAMVGNAICSMVAVLGGPGWVDVTVTAAVVGPLLVYSVVTGVAWLRDRRQWVTLYVWVDRDRAGVR